LWAGCALYAVSIVVLLVSHMGHGWGFVDLRVYERGGAAVRAGAHLYTLRFPGALAFTYPPFAALAFAGLTLPPNALLEPLVTAMSLALLPLMLSLALRLDLRSRPRAATPSPLGPSPHGLSALAKRSPARRDRLALGFVAAAAAVWLEPVWTTLRYGQIDLLVATLIVWDFSRGEGARSKGVGVGLATALKLTPGIFVLYLLLTRRTRAAAVSLATFATTVALGYLVLPGDSREYWGGAFAEPGRVGRIENAANQSLRGALARVLHTTDVNTLWLCLATLVAVVGLALAVAAARRGQEARGFSLCALTGLLVSPVSWSHHWVLAVPALALVALDAHRRRSVAVLAACAFAALLAYAHVIWWVPINHPPHSELHLDAPQLVLADAYVLAGLAALAVAALFAARRATHSLAALATSGGLAVTPAHRRAMLAGLVVIAAGGLAVLTPARALASRPYVAVSANHLVGAHGETIRLLGVDRSGSEYECLGGSQIFDGPVTSTAVKAMAAWHINAVRVPLNEDCWLSINGVNANVSGKVYQRAIKRYVHTLQGQGLIVILDLHWAAPGSYLANSQWPMADADHAPSFWSSVAHAFKSNHGVIFDLFNEPYITSWSCWLEGCSTEYDDAGTTVTYQTAGVQSLVSAVRATGARQVIMLGGLQYSSDESQWLKYEPTDPDHQLAVSFHTYNFSGCNEESCWSSTIAPLAKQVPVITGELGENGCTDTYIDQYMPWADAHGVSYLGWTWNSTGPPSYWSCGEGPALITDYEGEPTAFGIGLKEHLAALAAGSARSRR
jgi:hypothetical protein